MGRQNVITPSTYNPEQDGMNTIDFPSPAFLGEEPCFAMTEEISLTSSSSSTSTLLEECPLLSSSEIMFDDIDKDMLCTVGNSCEDDFFADFDANWEREHQQMDECKPCGLMHSGYSIYNPHFSNAYTDSFQPENDGICDFAMCNQQLPTFSAAIVSCGMEMPDSEHSNSRVGK